MVPIGAIIILFGGYLPGGADDPGVYVCSNDDAEDSVHVVHLLARMVQSKLSGTACAIQQSHKMSGVKSELERRGKDVL